MSIPCGPASPRAKAYLVCPEDVDPWQLAMGITTEMEHGRPLKVACQIALDHLVEVHDYYTRLLKHVESPADAAKIMVEAKRLMPRIYRTGMAEWSGWGVWG